MDAHTGSTTNGMVPARPRSHLVHRHGLDDFGGREHACLGGLTPMS